MLLPTDTWMYPRPPLIKFDFDYLETIMEGKFRPGHFNGVALVLSKLFHIVQPNRVYFGQKDLQQCLVVKYLIEDLSFDIQLVICPTVREEDGLAMSSRNRRLNEEQRKRANMIPATLFDVSSSMPSIYAQSELEAIQQEVAEHLAVQGVNLEYLTFADADTLQKPQESTQKIAICLAAFVDDVRLIDNIIVNRKGEIK